MNVRISKSLKEEFAWAIDKRLRVVSKKCYLKQYTTKKLKKKAVLNLKQILYALVCDP